MDSKRYLDAKGILLLTLLCASWGLNQVAIKVAITDISPALQAGLRSIGASILVLIWLRLRRQPLFEKDGTLPWGILVGCMFSFEFILIYWGLEYTHASRSAIFLNTAPFTVALCAHIFIPQERLRRLQMAGLVLAFLGILTAFQESLFLPTRRMLIGDIMLLSAAVIWGATTVVIKASPLSRINPAKTLLYQLGVSAILLPIASFVLKEQGIIQLSAIGIASMLYQTIWVAFITYIGWFWLISRYPVAKMSAFTFLTPLFGVMAGGLLLGESMTVWLISSLLMVCCGIFLVNRR